MERERVVKALSDLRAGELYQSGPGITYGGSRLGAQNVSNVYDVIGTSPVTTTAGSSYYVASAPKANIYSGHQLNQMLNKQ